MPEKEVKTLSKRWRFRFSIAFLLLLMTCVAGYFAGHQSGYESGYDSGSDAKYKATIVTQSYYVKDLIKPAEAPDDWLARKKDFDKLIDLITSTISANEWRNGSAVIRPFAKPVFLTIRCKRLIHEEITDLLQQLRDFEFKMPKNFLKSARSVAHRGKPSCQIIKAFPKISEHLHSILANNFHSAVGDLSDEFGSPVLNITSEAPVFPQWIGAQKIAIWNYGSGKFYLALVDCRPEGEALAIGWWEPEVGIVKPIILDVPVLVSAELVSAE